MDASAIAVRELLVSWGYEPHPRARTAAMLIKWYTAQHERELAEMKSKARAAIAENPAMRPRATAAMRNLVTEGDTRTQALIMAAEQSASMAEKATAQSRREGLVGVTAMEVPRLPSDRFTVPVDTTPTGAATEIAGVPDGVLYSNPTYAPGGNTDMSPIPQTPGQNLRANVDWLDKSRDSLAGLEEIARAEASGDFTNLSPFDLENDEVLSAEPPGTYQGPVGVLDLEGVQTAMLFDSKANVYYVPLNSDNLLSRYMGSKGHGVGGRGLLAVGLVAAAALILFSRK